MERKVLPPAISSPHAQAIRKAIKVVKMRERVSLKPKQREWLMYRRNAMELVRVIKYYWNTRGFAKFNCWLSPRTRMTADGTERTDYDIRSNLNGKGMPPR